MKTRCSRMLGIAAAMSLVLAACGDDDDDAGGADTTGPAEETTIAAESLPDEVTTVPEDTEAPVPPTGEPIIIGTLTSLTGPFTPWGLQVRDGMQLAVDEINEAGGVDGRPLELQVVDDQNNADEAVVGIQRLIDAGAVAIGGVISSTVGLSTAHIAEEQTTPLFLVKAGSEAILTRESRYTFRTCLPAAPMVAGPIVDYAQSEGLTKLGVIIADYEWGQSFRRALEAEVATVEGIELQVEVAPVPETDFTTYLRSLEGFGPELIVATGHPAGSGPITVQSADLGLNVPVTGAYAVLPTVMEGVADAAIGRYIDFDCADYFSADYEELAQRYLESSDNPFMEDDAVAAYGIVQMVAEAIGEVGDDRQAIAEYLHGQTFDLPGYSFEMGWTEWGELATAQPQVTVMSAGPAPEGINEAGDWYPELLLLPDPLEPYEP
jgi:branched-chain amino acid transport system substrate-binding protein